MRSEPMNLFVEAWKQMTSVLPSPCQSEDDGITTCFSDVPNLFFNLWFLSEPTPSEADFRDRLRRGKAAAEAWHQPVGGILREDWLPADWKAILADEGMTVMMDMVGMEAPQILPPPLPLADIEIRQIDNDEMAMAGAMINAHAYHMPEEQFTACGGMHFWPEGTLGFLGYVDGEPVATAGVRLVNETAYVFMVATEPGHQGKGYANVTMRHAIEAGKQALGRELQTLHATMDGSPTYAKMGFAHGPMTPLIIPASQG